MDYIWYEHGYCKRCSNLDMDHTDFLREEVYMCANTSHTHAEGSCSTYNFAPYTTTYLTTPQENIDLTAADTKFFALSLEEVYKAYSEPDDGQTLIAPYNDVQRYRTALYAPYYTANYSDTSSPIYPDGAARSLYWLRSPGYLSTKVAIVYHYGIFDVNIHVHSALVGVRPACYLDLTLSPLLAGPDFNAVLRDMLTANASANTVQFGTYDEITAENATLANLWNASTTYMDSAGKGTIRAFVYGNTVYILSQNSTPIYANEDCTHMFAHNASSTGKTGYIPQARLTAINGLDKLDTSNVTDLYSMFWECSWITSLDLTSFNTSNVTSMENMFYSCNKLTSLDLSSFNTRKVTNMECMFYNCRALVRIYVNANLWFTGNVSTHNIMFYNCTSLVGGTGMRYDANYIDKTYAHTSGYLTAK